MNPILHGNAPHDLLLVIAIRSGDLRAFDQLMNRYSDPVFYLILKMVNYKEVAKELTVESFEKAFINLHQYEQQFAFGSWLFRIAHNHTIDYLRKKNTDDKYVVSRSDDPKFRQSAGPDNFLSDTDNPEEALIKDENKITLRKFISGMKPLYRIPLEMRYFGECSYSEIASELNLPVGTVKMQLFRSRKLLCQLLKNSEISYS